MKNFKTTVAAAFLAGGAVACVAAMASAAQHTIREKGKLFSQSEITIKAGDTLMFENDDNVAHNVMSTTPANTFNMGLLKPGSATPVTFNTPGDILVICAIHPSMKLHVKVTN
jgi:plastocyanin